MTRKLLLPKEVKQLLLRRYNNQHKAWLLGEGQWPISFSLGVPTENDVANDAAGIRRWVDAWASWPGPGEVLRVSRQWPRLGAHELPAALELSSPAEVAANVGQGRLWQTAARRYQKLIERWPQLSGQTVVSRYFSVLADYGDIDFAKLFAMLDWLECNPASGLAPRQLPVAGIDTKWLEQRMGLITDLLASIREDDTLGDFYTVCGLRRPVPRIRIRILCAKLRTQVGGLKDIEAPLPELAALSIKPEHALIVENGETGIALPDMPGVVAFMRLGNAVSLLAALPWLQHCKTVYWGDIDTHGYAILNRARSLFPNLVSVMMDRTTFLAYQDLWVEEAVQSPEAELSLLTASERDAFQGLRNGLWGPKLRLEQERISWPEAMENLASLEMHSQISLSRKP